MLMLIFNSHYIPIKVISRKPLMGKFYDNSRGKDGKHRIKSRLNDLKDFEWLGLNLSNDAIRTRLKSFLNFGYE